MIRVVGVLMGAWIVAGLTGCAAQPAPTPAAPVPEPAASSESPAPDACAELTAADVRAAIAALPGWSYDFWSTSEALDRGPQPGSHARAEYVAPDRLRDVAWDPTGAPRGTIIIGDRMWVYPGRAESPAWDEASIAALASPLPGIVDADDFAIWLERVFPFKGSYMEYRLPFRGDLPGDGLRESPRVADTECLATDPNTGTYLVTTRSGQLVRMTSEGGTGRWIETKTLIFRANPPAIEPPTAEELLSKPYFLIPAKPRRTDPR